MTPQTARIVWFTGTGSTTLVAQQCASALERHGYQVERQNLRHDQADLPGKPDLLVVLFAVHACNAPHPVKEWIKRLDDGRDADGRMTPAIVISNSGGGEVWPNKACRLRTVKALQKKGYRCLWDDMVVLPSNWIIDTPEPLAVKLLDVLPAKINRMIDSALAGTERHSRPGPLNRLTAFLGQLETIGARDFGKGIAISDACNGCGLCVRGCPVGNISLAEGTVKIGGACILCLNCIYHCPKKALAPRKLKFILAPSGYDLKKLIKRQPWAEPIDLDALASGPAWIGVKRYLQEP